MSHYSAARKTNRRPSFSFSAPARRENTRQGSLFVFGDSSAVEVESSDYEGIEMPVLSHRKGNKATTPDVVDQKSKFQFVYRDLAPSDTLASLSLQYGCPVAEIKRANNIYTDQDFHGRVQLRIPVPVHSLMTDPSEQARMQPAPGTSYKDLPNGTDDYPELEDHMDDDDDGYARTSALKSADEAQKLLKRLDEDLSSVKQQIEDEDGVLHDEQSQLMSRVAPNPEATAIAPLSESTAVKQMEYATVCGLSWRHMIIVGIIVITVPILGVIYIVKHRNIFPAHWFGR
ncbi:lysM and putative peptidoglycan-binding domain-containing protein 3-like [Sycon ciliatum]|uniref:lysM and putative peptidoglycan-binding domain-containing protein 3-like n=1 Tax=Sycon ciliatum TaxID=27933 RepID=UPI0020AC54AE|eukprot:scpid61097/ scgid14038/ LysM and putative peptidoglycan-binding domain-containing protein 4